MKTCNVLLITFAGVSSVCGVSCMALASEAAGAVNAIRIITAAAIVSCTLVNVCAMHNNYCAVVYPSVCPFIAYRLITQKQKA